mgnify:CR=1 FL=1
MAKLDAGKIKDDAGKYLRRGKLDKALEAYILLEKAEPNDLRVPQKIAELMVKLGQKDQGLAKYYESAEKYHQRGFLVQAIAIYKIILDISPKDTKAADILKQLTEERTGPSLGVKPKPAASPTTAEILAMARKPGASGTTAEPITAGMKLAHPPQPEPQAAEPAAGPEELIATEPEELGTEAVALGDEESAGGPIPLGDEDETKADKVGEEFSLSEEADDEAAVRPDDAEVEIEVEAGEDELSVEATEYAEAASIEVIPLDEEEELPTSGPERTPLFSDLSGGEFDRVFELLQSRVVEPGTVIVREGESGDSIYIIARGQARVSRADEDGADREVARLGPGDFFGEIGYFHGERRATVTATKKTQLLEMAKADLDQVVSEFPRVKEVLVKFYRERVLENLLADSPLFKDIPVAELHKFRDAFSWLEIPAGQAIVKEGDPGDSMFLIKAGEVLVQTKHPITNETVELAKLKGGDFFGEVSLIKNKPRTASVVAVTEAEVMELSRNDFQAIASVHPHLGSALEQTIEQRVENTIKKMMEKM